MTFDKDWLLDVKHLNISYGKKKPVVFDINLKIKNGSIVSLIGPNACGKSTVIKALSGIIPYTKGDILFQDKRLEEYKRKEKAQNIAVLLQNNTIPNNLTVKELVTYGRTPYITMLSGTSKKDEEIVEWAIECTKITHLINKSIGQLSGGERQKALFAMAISRQPKLLILDEPTTFLDICHQIEILDLAKQMNQNFKMSVLMVLHDLNQASYYSNYVYVMNKGKLVLEGTPAKVLTEKQIQKYYHVESKISCEEWKNKPFIKILGLSKAKRSYEL